MDEIFLFIFVNIELPLKYFEIAYSSFIVSNIIALNVRKILNINTFNILFEVTFAIN